MIAFALANLGTIAAILFGGGGLATGLLGRFGPRAILAWFGRHREILVLVPIVAAAAFCWWRYEVTKGQRDAALAWRDRACIAAGAAARTPAECFGRIDALAAFERDTLAASNAALAAGLAEGRRKGVADRNIADLAARERRAASESMEAANARIGTDDHVGGDWFAALNRAAGLRAPR